MKIAFLVDVFPTMSEYFILQQITGLIDRGHDVDIFAHFHGRYSQVHEEVQKYRLLQRTFYSLSIPDNKFKRLLKGMYLFVSNFHRCPVVLLRSLNIFKYGKESVNLRLLYSSIPFVGKGPYDIVHAHFGPNGLRGASVRRIEAIKGRFITTFHGYDVTTYVSWKGEDVYRELFKKGDLFTYNSEATKQKVMRLHCPSHKLTKLPMGVDLKKKQFSEKNLNHDGCTKILSVGRLVEMKGREYAIRAVARLAKRFSNIKYTIVGDGPLRKKLQNLVYELGVQETISFTGWVSSEKLNSLYRNSHLFLHPSVKSSDGNMEGQGVVLLEAQAYGLPVVATHHNAFPETVADDRSGFLVPEKDVDALADKLMYLIEHPEIWPEMGRAGRAHVEANYDINKLNDRLVEIYRKLL
jgi:colanic acid/amylovoran biosynthesis glycosyltransferase